MIPIRDTVRARTFPVTNWILIGINTGVFLYEATLTPSELNSLIRNFGLIPARLNFNNPLSTLFSPLAMIPVFTHIFLHSGWFHFLSNIWTLFIFGDNVEDRMGAGRYLIFFICSGIVAGLAQAFITQGSQLPAIGASGAIAGVLGAYLFMYPRARVITLIPIFIIPWFVSIPAVFYLGFWFVSQLFSGVLSLDTAGMVGGVAWWAHIGGFSFGLLFYRLFMRPRRSISVNSFPEEVYSNDS